jgi:hypothetical protein
LPRIIIIDERRSLMFEDGSNLDTPNVKGALVALEHADVVVSVEQDGIYIKRGEIGVVGFMRVKGEPEMSMNKALVEKSARNEKRDPYEDDKENALKKFDHVWEGTQMSIREGME